MIKKLSIIILGILLLISMVAVASAKIEYAQIGGEGNDFNLGEGFFGASSNFLTRGVGTTTDTQVPLVVDLDGDGSSEIIILDTDTIRLFNSTLGVKDTVSTGVSGRKSNIISFDIDGDSKIELIVVGEVNELVTIVEWNGTDLFIQNQYNWSNPEYHDTGEVGGEVQINCESANKCLMAVSSTFTTTGTVPGNTTAVSFNSTGVIDFTFIRSQGSNGRYCSPYIKSMEVADLTGNGDFEYIWSLFNFDDTGASTEEVEIFAVTLDSNLKPILQSGFPIIITGLPDETFSATCETQEIGHQFSPPLVFNALGGSTNQILIAFENSGTSFKIHIFDELGAFIDDFPEASSGDSNLISNVFRGNFFPDTASFDFCAMGYDDSPPRLDLVCSSLLSGEFPETNSYRINITGKFVAPTTFGAYDGIAHSTNHENTQSQCLDVSCSANDLDEVLTPYGIHRLDREGFICDKFGSCDLIEVFFNPFNTSGTFVSVDTTGAGAEDLLLLTDSNLFLFDALFLDQPAEIDRTSISINPCIDSAWQINTSSIISFKVDDTDPVPVSDLDQVFAQVLLYADSTNEQESDVQTGASGTTFFFDETTFLINKTTGAGVIRLLGNDSGSTAQDIVNVPFTVSETGLELGDCVTEGFDVPEAPIEIILDATLTEDATDNSITSGINTFAGLTGLGGTTLWLFFMIAITAGIWFRASEMRMSGSSAMGTIAIFNILMIMLGARIGILSTALIVIIVVISVVIIGVFLGKFLTGSRTDT